MIIITKWLNRCEDKRDMYKVAFNYAAYRLANILYGELLKVN